MKAAVMRANNAPLEIEELEIDDPGPGEVLVKTAASGICHSDLTVIEGGLPVPPPCVLGHEPAGIVEAVGEALLLASKAGADPCKVRDALMGGFAGSRILDLHGKRMLTRSFDPGFRIRLHQKDLNLALEAAMELGVSLPNTATAQELFNAVKAQKGGDLDHSAMVFALERLADHRIEDN